MRILFDQNIPRNLRQFLARHEVQTAARMGWGRVENGELLARAEEAGFDVFLTGDQNLSYQQNLHAKRIGIVELTKNNWPSVQPHITEIVQAVETCGVGGYQRVVCEYVYKPRSR
jgi:predicted nuclease of predicted toxin-antitoxin system